MKKAPQTENVFRNEQTWWADGTRLAKHNVTVPLAGLRFRLTFFLQNPSVLKVKRAAKVANDHNRVARISAEE